MVSQEFYELIARDKVITYYINYVKAEFDLLLLSESYQKETALRQSTLQLIDENSQLNADLRPEWLSVAQKRVKEDYEVIYQGLYADCLTQVKETKGKLFDFLNAIDKSNMIAQLYPSILSKELSLELIKVEEACYKYLDKLKHRNQQQSHFISKIRTFGVIHQGKSLNFDLIYFSLGLTDFFAQVRNQKILLHHYTFRGDNDFLYYPKISIHQPVFLTFNTDIALSKDDFKYFHKNWFGLLQQQGIKSLQPQENHHGSYCVNYGIFSLQDILQRENLLNEIATATQQQLFTSNKPSIKPKPYHQQDLFCLVYDLVTIGCSIKDKEIDWLNSDEVTFISYCIKAHTFEYLQDIYTLLYQFNPTVTDEKLNSIITKGLKILLLQSSLYRQQIRLQSNNVNLLFSQLISAINTNFASPYLHAKLELSKQNLNSISKWQHLDSTTIFNTKLFYWMHSLFSKVNTAIQTLDFTQIDFNSDANQSNLIKSKESRSLAETITQSHNNYLEEEKTNTKQSKIEKSPQLSNPALFLSLLIGNTYFDTQTKYLLLDKNTQYLIENELSLLIGVTNQPNKQSHFDELSFEQLTKSTWYIQIPIHIEPYFVFNNWNKISENLRSLMLNQPSINGLWQKNFSANSQRPSIVINQKI